MFKQRNIKKKIAIALVLMFLGVCTITINVQFYTENQIASHVTSYYKNRTWEPQKDLFSMSIEELMEVTVISQSRQG